MTKRSADRLNLGRRACALQNPARRWVSQRVLITYPLKGGSAKLSPPAHILNHLLHQSSIFSQPPGSHPGTKQIPIRYLKYQSNGSHGGAGEGGSPRALHTHRRGHGDPAPPKPVREGSMEKKDTGLWLKTAEVGTEQKQGTAAHGEVW